MDSMKNKVDLGSNVFVQSKMYFHTQINKKNGYKKDDNKSSPDTFCGNDIRGS